jgi:signal transduction histidine kinase
VIVLGQLLLVSFVAPLPGVLPDLLVLVVVAALATTAELREPVPLAAGLGEAVLAAAAVGLTGEASLLLPYLIVPGFAVGLRRGWRLGTVAVLVSLVVLLLAAVVTGLDDPVAQLAPIGLWSLAALLLALLGSWGRGRLTVPVEPDAYADAARLLDEFDALTPRLSGGLDTAALAEALLDGIAAQVPHDHAGVWVVRDDQGRPTLLASRLAPPEWLDACSDALGQTSPQLGWWTVPVGPASRLSVAVDRVPALTADEQSIVNQVVTAYGLPLRAAETFHGIWKTATQQERLRLSREIHDGIAQDLASLAYAADEGVEVADTGSDRQRMEELRDSLRLVLGELRISMFDLRAAESRAPLAAAVSDLARRTAEAAGQRLEVRISGSGSLPVEVEQQLTRVAQEALTNVRKHAEAERLWVSIDQRGDEVSLRVADDGRGLDWRERPALSAGLAGMQERADAVGATFTIGPPVDGPGTVVRVEYGGSVHAGGRAADRAAR